MDIEILHEVELLHRARAGEAEAVQGLYEKYLKNSAPILRLLQKALAKVEDQEDALHDILVTLLENKTEFRGESHLSTYIFQIARLTLFQRFRRERAAKRSGALRRIAESDARTEAASPETPHYSYERKEVREILQRLIAALPEAYREAVRLRILEEQSYEAVAERLQIPGNTAATKIHKGKKILLERLKTLGYWKAFLSEK